MEDIDDLHRTFGEINPTLGAVRSQMVQIAKHQFRRTLSSKWLEELRFIVAKEPTPPSRIEVAEKTTDFVAVSYCWSRGTVSEYISRDLPDFGRVIDLGVTRSWRAPEELLYRACSFAFSHGLRLVWIDQECINQDDPVEKEEAIQLMDIVYERSIHSVAILDIYLVEQDQVDAITGIVNEETFIDARLFGPLSQVLEMLVADPWFQRAWTLQESTAAGARITLLMACNPGLNVPEPYNRTPREVAIRLWDLQIAMVTLRCMIEEMEPSDEDLKFDADILTDCSNFADILYNSWPEISSVSGNHLVASLRRGSSAALALNYLDDRKNSWFPDRLAILANLCNFDVRIPSYVLTSLGMGFSVSALTLATLNGDTSLWTGFSLDNDSSVTDLNSPAEDVSRAFNILDRSKDMRFNPYGTVPAAVGPRMVPHGFSWCPPAAGSLSNITYFEEYDDWFRLSPATLSEHGLKVSGALWKMDKLLLVPLTQNRFMPTWLNNEEHELEQKLGTETGSAVFEHRYVAEGIVWHLLLELNQHGHRPIAETVYNWAKPVGKRSDWYRERLDLESPRAFSEVLPVDKFFPQQNPDSKAWSHAPLVEAFDRPPIRLFEAGSLSKRESKFRTHTMTHQYPYTLTHQILKQVFEKGSILCGRCISSPEAPQAPYVFFEDCEEGDLIFTPYVDLGRPFYASVWVDKAVSWVVERTGETVEGCGVLKCTGRKRGYWRMDDIDARQYVLG